MSMGTCRHCGETVTDDGLDGFDAGVWRHWDHGHQMPGSLLCVFVDPDTWPLPVAAPRSTGFDKE